MISAALSAEIHSMRKRGVTLKAIAEAVGMNTMAVYQHLRRRGGLTASVIQVDRVTRWVPFNGGCSTTSGMRPVTLPRLECLREKEF